MMIRLGTILLSMLAVAACTEPPDLGVDTLGMGPGSGSHEQGRLFLGELADALPGPMSNAYFPAAGTSSSLGTLSVVSSPNAGSCLGVTIAGVAHTCADPIFINAVLYGPNGQRPRFRIADVGSFVIVGEGGHPATGYVLQENHTWPGTGPDDWRSYCVDDRVAYPMSGKIVRAGGLFLADSATITFACSEYDAAGHKPPALPDLTGNGVAAKAMSWGFLPGANGTQMYTSVAVSGDVLHQGAVAAGRANYCADGASHTLDATSIQIFDLVTGNLAPDGLAIEPSTPPTATPIDPANYSFESVWRYDTVTPAAGQTLYLWHPLCLSKLRWQALPLGNRCITGTQLLDPRVPGNDAERFCDDYTPDELAHAGGMIGIYSQWNDLGLWRWHNPGNHDFYTTTLGTYDDTAAMVPPDSAAYGATVPELEGTLLTTVGAPIFQANYPTTGGVLTGLFSCPSTTPSGAKDWVTAGQPWLALHGFWNAITCHSEGLIWTTPPAAAVQSELGWSMVELKMWKKNGEHVTSISAPTGYTTLVTSVGWIVKPASW
ncbi:MAG TPA: ADYC domain-containing protein [Kofleriaceae bacterium]|nr:ADYC domain-containing protein [Kofleriaceae bacterium]